MIDWHLIGRVHENEIYSSSHGDRTAGIEGLGAQREGGSVPPTTCRVLLWADESDQEFGLRDAEIAEEVGLRDRTVSRFRQWCVEQGLAAALERPPRKRERLRVQDGEPPPGQSRWTLQTTVDRLVELGVVESISHEVVQQVLNKHL